MKKLYGLIVFMIAFCILPKWTDAAEIPLSTKNPSYKEAKYLYDLHIIDDAMANSLDNKMKFATREEAIVLLSKIIGLENNPQITEFWDVTKSSSEYSGYIQNAYKKGIVTGYSDKSFRPMNTLTRGQLAAFIERSFGEYLNTDVSKTFKDVKKSNYSYTSVQAMYASNITKGYPDNTFRPNQKLTKQHLITFVYRTVKFLETNSVNIPLLAATEDNGVEENEIEEKKDEDNKPIVFTPKQLEKYLNETYSILHTKVADAKFKFEVEENDNINFNYDYLIEMNFDEISFNINLNSHADSINYADTAAEDVALAENQLKTFMEEFAKDIISRAPGKKILGRDYDSGYKYPAIKEGSWYEQSFTWTNYEPKEMVNTWPGERPDDYFEIMYLGDIRDNQDIKAVYIRDEKIRTAYSSEYIQLNYKDMVVTDFGWRSFLDKARYNY